MLVTAFAFLVGQGVVEAGGLEALELIDGVVHVLGIEQAEVVERLKIGH